MIFTKLRVRNFGKLQELEINLGEKLNIIFGSNEAGKTTILAFLKAMLYGMNSQRRALRENDRLRYKPWDGDFGEGELYFREEGGREYILRRNLSSRRRDDWTVLDAVTGQPADKYNAAANPGAAILGLGEAAYTRTIFVPQLGCAVTPDKEDEIMARLMNLQQTGEEQVSLQKALTDLEKERKRLTLRSGNGKLDSLRSRQADLLQEKQTVESLHEQNIHDQAELNGLLEEKVRLEEAFSELEKQKVSLKEYKQYLEYLELQKEADALQHWQDELAAIEQSLVCGSNSVDAAFIADCEIKLANWHQKTQLMGEQEEELRGKKAELEEIEAGLGAYQGFPDLPEDIETQLVIQEQKGKRCTEALDRITKYQQEIEGFQRALEEKNASLGLLANFYHLSAEEEEQRANQEKLLKELEEKVKHDQQIDALRRDFITDKVSKARNGLISGTVLTVGGILLGIFVHPICYLLALLGVGTGLSAYLQRKKNKATLAELDSQLAANSGVLEDYEALLAELSEFYQRFGATDKESFLEKRRTFESLNGEIGVIKAIIADREGYLSLEKEAEVREQLEESREFISRLLNTTSCQSLHEFQEKLTTFRERTSKLENLKREIADMEQRLAKLMASREEVARGLATLLGYTQVENGDIAQIEGLLQEYKMALGQKSNLSIRLETETINFEKHLAGRDLGTLADSIDRKLIEEMTQNGFEPMNDNPEKVALLEESLEKGIKEFSEERLNLEKKITGLNAAINNRLQDARELARIEEELAETDRQIKKYEEIVEVLDYTKEMFEASFQELQNSFGPILNSKVGQIMQGITAGQYQEVKVAESYLISVKDHTDSIRNLQYFSNGTLDQVYFALRLGIVELAFNQEHKLPLFLDDAFVQYDDKRLASTLNFLLDYAEQHQVLLFTCHNREMDYLRGKNFNYFTL
jgi:exonuclease SbcC